jgi:hypothetical protein
MPENATCVCIHSTHVARNDYYKHPAVRTCANAANGHHIGTDPQAVKHIEHIEEGQEHAMRPRAKPCLLKLERAKENENDGN